MCPRKVGQSNRNTNSCIICRDSIQGLHLQLPQVTRQQGTRWELLLAHSIQSYHSTPSNFQRFVFIVTVKMQTLMSCFSRQSISWSGSTNSTGSFSAWSSSSRWSSSTLRFRWVKFSGKASASGLTCQVKTFPVLKLVCRSTHQQIGLRHPPAAR